jgi:prevent-host-death family protein
MTMDDYYVVMARSDQLQVGVAQLKAKLSEYLRQVRRGRTVVVLDRDRPVARLAPYEAGEPLRVRPPLGKRRFQDIPLPAPLSLPPGFDIVELLMEDREDRP